MQTHTPGVSFFLLSHIVLLVCGCLLAGCRSPSSKGAEGRPPIELARDGSVLFHGKALEAKDLPRKLKSYGYETDAPVHIVVPAEMTPAALAHLSATLASSGFRHVIFVKARRVEAYVNEKKKK